MKFLVFLLFPFCLSSQNYRLDSIWHIGHSASDVTKFYYQDNRNFQRQYIEYNSNEIAYSFISFFEDSLEVKQLFNSSMTVFEYDSFRRKSRETNFKHDTISQDNHFAYHLASDLLEYKDHVYYRNGDTAVYRFEHIDYDSLLREIHSIQYHEVADTFFRASEDWRNYVSDSLTYFTGTYSRIQGVWDTSYSKTISLPKYYFGDTLRTERKYFALTKDSLIINSTEHVQFTWGDFNSYENAGQWFYSDNDIYATFIEYEPISNGFAFVVYESKCQEGDPLNWKDDIENCRQFNFNGTLKVNDAGLPLQRIVVANNGNTDRTEWYYSEISSVNEPMHSISNPKECKIITRLQNDTIYFDMTGRRVNEISSSQYLIAKHNQKIERVLYIID